MTDMQPYGGRAVVASGLNLWLPLKDPARMPELIARLQTQRLELDARLSELGHVHFARFVPAPVVKPGSTPPASGGVASALQVITEFDGDFDAYVMDFAMTIKNAFNLILSYVAEWPDDPNTLAPMKVEDYPAFFLDFIRKRDLGYFDLGQGPIRMFSAYPRKTVLDIVGTAGMAPEARSPAPEVVDRADVQANVLRGIGARLAWHWGLKVSDRFKAGALLASLLPGAPGAGLKLSNDADWQNGTRPDYWLTLGLSYRGLQALRLSKEEDAALRLAHAEFVRGPDDLVAAKLIGDVGGSDPATWRLGGPHPVDLMFTLYADDEATLMARADALRAAVDGQGLAEATAPWLAQDLPYKPTDPRPSVHFGYVDDLAQPRLAIAGGDPGGKPSLNPDARVGEFLLGSDYTNVYGGRGTLGGLPAALAQNATFAAVRIMAQDVAAFEDLLDKAVTDNPGAGDREWFAAKLMGRWRDGTPLSLSPTDMNSEHNSSNRFDYRPSADHPGTLDDSAGLRCPMGAHARRMNPRSARVAGLAHSRRLIRRGMPYGPAFDPKAPDEKPRGLYGLFHCADLKRQYEFILREWAQGDTATPGIAGQQDPIIGAQCPVRPEQDIGKSFEIPMASGTPIRLAVPRLVTTVGSVYLLMPGLAGLAHLARRAQQPDDEAAKAEAKAAAMAAASLAMAFGPISPEATAFDARDPAFRADPFPVYKTFRQKEPGVYMPRMDSLWVFDHATVKAIAMDPSFHKRMGGPLDVPKGLLTMDKPFHTGLRVEMAQHYGAVFNDAAKTDIRGFVSTAWQGIQARGCADLVRDLAAPLTEEVFFRLYGLHKEGRPALVAMVKQMLATASPLDDKATRLAIKKLSGKALEELTEHLAKKRYDETGLLARCFAISNGPDAPFDPVSNTPTNGVDGLKVEQFTNALTLMMSGLVPMQSFIQLALWRLLENGGTQLDAVLKTRNAVSSTDIVRELLRYDTSTPQSNRFPTQRSKVGRFTVEPGQRVVLCWASANRDDKVFADGDSIVFGRANLGDSLAFGVPTDRYCLGWDLIETVGAALVDSLREEGPMPRIRLGWKPAFTAGAMFRPMAELPVTFNP